MPWTANLGASAQASGLNPAFGILLLSMMRLPFRVAPPPGWFAEPPVSAWLAVPLTLIIAVPVADLFLPPGIHLAHLLAVAPAFTAAVAGTRLTAAISALAALALTAAGAERDSLTTESVLVELGSLIALSALLVAFSVFRARRNRELARVRRVSAATQRVVLRPLPERAGPLSIASAYRAFDADSTDRRRPVRRHPRLRLHPPDHRRRARQGARLDRQHRRHARHLPRPGAPPAAAAGPGRPPGRRGPLGLHRKHRI